MTTTATRATYTVEEAAELLGTSTTTVYRMIRAGRFPVQVIEVTGLGCLRKAYRIPARPLRELLGVAS